MVTAAHPNCRVVIAGEAKQSQKVSELSSSHCSLHRHSPGQIQAGKWKANYKMVREFDTTFPHTALWAVSRSAGLWHISLFSDRMTKTFRTPTSASTMKA